MSNNFKVNEKIKGVNLFWIIDGNIRASHKSLLRSATQHRGSISAITPTVTGRPRKLGKKIRRKL